MKEKIFNRLDEAINNLKNENFEKLFPLILDDLEYIFVAMEKDREQLTDVDEFECGSSINKKIINYFSKLAKIYFKLMFRIDINIINSKDYNLSIAGGGYNEKDGNIYYTDLGTMLSMQSKLSFLHMCLHEGRHKMQHEFYNSDNLVCFPPYMLRLLKEKLLECSLQDNNREFYTTNYDILFAEIDAEIFAKKEIYNFIKNMTHMYIKLYNMPFKEINNILIKVNKLSDIFNSILTNESFNISDNIALEIYNNNSINSHYLIDGNQVDRLIFIDKYIKSNPELQNKYPILRLLFNGQFPKDYEEIMHDKNVLKEKVNVEDKQKIDNLYNEIIVLDPILTLTNLLEKKDSNSFIEYLNLHPTIFNEYPEEIKKLNEKYKIFDDTTILRF